MSSFPQSHQANCHQWSPDEDILAGLSLRPMAKEDIDQVVRLIGKAMNPDEATQAKLTLQRHWTCRNYGMEDGRCYWTLLDEGGNVLGVVGLHHYEWGPVENVWLAWFAVEPTLQKQGIGAYLIDTATRLAQKQGYRKFFIETYSTVEFELARRFYCSKGFQVAGHINAYLPDGGDMVVFSKELTHHA